MKLHFTRFFKSHGLMLLAVILLQALLFTACEKSKVDKPINEHEQGAVRPAGQPLAEPISKRIGAAGGSISSADNRISIEIPAGALGAEQEVSLQAIENTNGPGLGVAYRLSPHGFAFQKPVHITFSYAADDLSSTLPEFLGIAYQDEQGVWQAIGGVQHNAANKTFGIKTLHFSDWSLFRSLAIEPGEATIAPGENLSLKVYKYLYHDDLLATLLPDEFEAPIREKEAVEAKITEEWLLGGPGQLTPAGNTATYRAPQQIQDPVTVAVSARIKSPDNSLRLLVSNITVAREGITFRVNGGEWIHYPAPMNGVDNGTALVSGSGGGTFDQLLQIYWEVGESYMEWNMDFPDLIYKETEYFTNYSYYAAGEDNLVPSPGYLQITHMGDVGGYMSGSFRLEKSGRFDDRLLEVTDANPWVGEDLIEGFFYVKRSF